MTSPAVAGSGWNGAEVAPDGASGSRASLPGHLPFPCPERYVRSPSPWSVASFSARNASTRGATYASSSSKLTGR
jgi:hypothetical protein